jgi:transposase
MIDPLPIPDELWAKVPPDAKAAIVAILLAMQQRVNELETRVRDLEARLKLNSNNSSKPPSSDPIGMKRKPPAPPSGKKRGGQPGHRKAHRALVPPEKVHESIHCKPTACRRCGHGLSGDDPEPLIHQVAELPKIEPIVDEYRLHRLSCPGCGETTCGTLPPGRPHRMLRPLLPGCAGRVRGGLSAQQTTDPAGVRRPVYALELHRDDLQAGTAVDRGDREAFRALGNFDDFIAGAHLTLFQNAKIEPRAVMRDQQRRHPSPAPPPARQPARAATA